MREPPRLACGTSYDSLIDQVVNRAGPADARHQANCPHCRAALAELRTLWAPVLELADTHVRAPADILTTVMTRVHELGRHTWHAVIPTERGQTRIAARVVAAVARLAAEELPAVTLALGEGRTTEHATRHQIAHAEDATNVGVAGTHVVVDVQVAVEIGTNIPATAEQLRTHVAHHIATQLGLTATEINVTIADVQAPPGHDA